VNKKPETETPQLEASLAEISALIEKMEHGQLTLEESLKYFERGIKLVRACQKMLEQAEQKVQILIQNNQQEKLTTFDFDTKETNNKQKNEGLPDETARE
jgi:exodeoxyribonuclease VII small subunit